MKDRILRTVRFKTKENRDGIEIHLGERDLEYIFAELRNDIEAYNSFSEFCRKLAARSDENAEYDGFREKLIEIIEKRLGYGRMLFTFVLQEMAKRQSDDLHRS